MAPGSSTRAPCPIAGRSSPALARFAFAASTGTAVRRLVDHVPSVRPTSAAVAFVRIASRRSQVLSRGLDIYFAPPTRSRALGGRLAPQARHLPHCPENEPPAAAPLVERPGATPCALTGPRPPEPRPPPTGPETEPPASAPLVERPGATPCALTGSPGRPGGPKWIANSRGTSGANRVPEPGASSPVGPLLARGSSREPRDATEMNAQASGPFRAGGAQLLPRRARLHTEGSELPSFPRVGGTQRGRVPRTPNAPRQGRPAGRPPRAASTPP